MARFRPLGIVSAAILIAVALSSCSPTPAPVSTPAPSPSATPLGDGVLRIGTLFPNTGSAAFIAPAQLAGTDLAVADINKAGGVLGTPVEILHADSGDASTGTMEASFADLVSKKADVIVGPSSSVLAERLLPKAIAAGVPVIATAATSPRLSILDDNGFLFRTTPSTALEGSALAKQLAKTKGVKAALIYFGDDSGTALSATFTGALKRAGGTLVDTEKFVAGTDVAPILANVIKAKPDVVVLSSPFSAIEQNKAIITALTAAGLGKEKLWLTDGAAADYSQALPEGLVAGVNGILDGAPADDAFTARVKAINPAVTDVRYAAEAYDATILAALAAESARDASGRAIAVTLRAVSEGGIKCTDYAQCLQVLKTQRDIDYDGISGPISFDAHGDPTIAHFGLYRYTGENRLALVGSALG